MGFRHKPDPLPSFHPYSDSLSDFSHISGRLDGLELDGCRWCHLLQRLTTALFGHLLVYSGSGQRSGCPGYSWQCPQSQQIGRCITHLPHAERDLWICNFLKRNWSSKFLYQVNFFLFLLFFFFLFINFRSILPFADTRSNFNLVSANGRMDLPFFF